MYRPTNLNFNTPIRIKHRISTDVNGAPEISYQDANPALDFCLCKSKGGTESIQAGTIVIDDTAELTMWYRDDISQKDVVLLNDNADLAYEVIGPPENIEMRNEFMILKVRRTVID